MAALQAGPAEKIVTARLFIKDGVVYAYRR